MAPVRALLVLALLAPALAGCVGGSETGTLRVEVVGAEALRGVFSELDVVVAQLILTGERGFGFEHTPQARGVDLLAANGTIVFTGDVAAANYSALEIRVPPATGTLADGREALVEAAFRGLTSRAPFVVPSGGVLDYRVVLQATPREETRYALALDANATGPVAGRMVVD